MALGEDEGLDFVPLTRRNLESVSEIAWYPNDRSFRLYVGRQVLDGIGPNGLCKVAIVQEVHMAIESMLFATMNEGQTESGSRTLGLCTQSFLTGLWDPLDVITNLFESNFGKRFKSCEVGDNCVRVMLA